MSRVESPKPVRRRAALLFAAFVISCSLAAQAGAQVPSPRSVLGFQPTDDRTIADWTQIRDYFSKLDAASKRVTVQEIGRSTKGRPLIVAFISSEKNIRNLDKIRRISARLADPRTISNENELSQLLKDGKTIVSISCSIHSTEIVASQMSMNLAYELATANDPDTKEILDNTVLMLIPSPNPDGIDIVADWYRRTLGTKSEGTAPPELYHHYAGHDDNRDWFMMNLVETQAVTKLFWQQWFPQIVYDVHQQGQNSSRFIIPPFFDPINPRISPSIIRETGLIGYKMAADLQAQNISGVATNSTYDTWWHGGFRSAPYYHNSIGILSEAASTNLMSPVTVKPEDLKRSRGVRGLASLTEPMTNFPDPWEGGEWRPADINRIEMISSRALLSMAAKYRERYLRNFYQLGKDNLTPKPEEPTAFIISGGQPDGEAVSRLIEILMWQGIEVHLMTEELYTKMLPGDKDFHEMPMNSWLIFANQPQKNNILSLLERQVYPDRRLPNGEAEVPYDVAGWTLPLQMGVVCEAIYDIRDAAKARQTLRRVESINSVRASLSLEASNTPFTVRSPAPLRSAPRVGLYRGSTGSMDEGWTRFVLDTFRVPFARVSDADIRSGNIGSDVVILPAESETTMVKGLAADRYPAEFAGGMTDAGIENLKKYVENGGRLVCFDDSCEMVIKRFALPIKNALAGLKRSEFYNPGSIVQLEVDQKQPLARGLAPQVPAYFSSSSAFEVAGGSLTAAQREQLRGLKVAARYAESNALLSGWMLGERYLNGRIALAEIPYGKGRIVLFAFRPQHRGQSWGTFPFIFNALEK